MRRPNPYSKRTDASFVDTPEGLYDGDTASEDLWFLPQEYEDDGPMLGLQTPVPATSLIVAADWLAAQSSLADDLARLSFDLGRLAERVALKGAGWIDRLAQAEAVSLSWWLGDRITSDRLALWLGYRIGAVGDEAPGLIRTGWTARKLAAPRINGQANTIGEHLGLEGEAAMLAQDADRVLEPLAPLHPVTVGCAAFHLWRALEERPDHLRDPEAAVLGARLAGAQGVGFLPLSLAGLGGLIATGPTERRLAAWIGGAHQATLAALLTLDRLSRWEANATQATADLSGRTPTRLIAALTHQPMITAQGAETATGASRAAVQRNLTEFERRALIREVTGQGRFRVWTARL